MKTIWQRTVITMSVSKWAYEPSKCDGSYCCGECDKCYIQYFNMEAGHMIKRAAIRLKIKVAVETAVKKLNEIQEERNIKQERSLFE